MHSLMFMLWQVAKQISSSTYQANSRESITFKTANNLWLANDCKYCNFSYQETVLSAVAVSYRKVLCFDNMYV